MGHRIRVIVSSMSAAFSVAALGLFILLSPPFSPTAHALAPGAPCACGCSGSCGTALPIQSGSIYNCVGTCTGGCGSFPWSPNCDASCGCNPIQYSIINPSNGMYSLAVACTCY